jgi:hypothetical protein
MSSADTGPVEKETEMRAILLRLFHELGNGRALANARREHDEMQRIEARLQELAAAA